MAKVTYLGVGGLAHHHNPSGTEYIFNGGKPHEVTLEDALFYAEEATRGGPWKVDGLPGQAAEPAGEVKPEAKEEIKEDVPAARMAVRRGGKR